MGAGGKVWLAHSGTSGMSTIAIENGDTVHVFAGKGERKPTSPRFRAGRVLGDRGRRNFAVVREARC